MELQVLVAVRELLELVVRVVNLVLRELPDLVEQVVLQGQVVHQVQMVLQDQVVVREVLVSMELQVVLVRVVLQVVRD